MSRNLSIHQSCASDYQRSSLYLAGYTRHIWERSISSVESLVVFLRLMSQTIEACHEGNYTKFDAQTTSNCCHGLSILTREIILSVEDLDLQILQFQAINQITQLEGGGSLEEGLLFLKNLPAPLIDLISLYLLTFIVEIDPVKGRRTLPGKLKELGRLGTSFCRKIVKLLQRSFSNIVAERYTCYLQETSENLWIDRIPVRMWGKYIQKSYQRLDKRGVTHASCLFSMQVSLSYLTETGAIIAIVNDLIHPTTMAVTGRYVCLLQNNGMGQLVPLSGKQISALKEPHKEPVVVFGGYVFSETLDLKTLSLKMQPWIYQVPSLILACDTHYPQFPKVADDLEFNNDAISPTEDVLKIIIHKHSKIQGVSADCPTLFCLSHIFVANARQVINANCTAGESALPSCFIPCEAASTYLSH